MKITRRQLRKMINEAIFLEHRIKPVPTNIPPQHLDKIHDLIMGGELEMAQSLVDAFDGPPNYAHNYIDYEEAGDLEKLGNQAADMFEPPENPDLGIWSRRPLKPGYEFRDVLKIDDLAMDTVSKKARRLGGEWSDDHMMGPEDEHRDRYTSIRNKPIYHHHDDDYFLKEHRIKPSIPGLESDEYVEKIDTLARGEDTRDMSDVMADTFGYSGSYLSDLHDYDNISPLRITALVSPAYDPDYPNPPHPEEPFKHEFVVPNHLVDKLIEEYENIESYDVSGLIVAARKIEKHLISDINHQLPGYVIDDFTSEMRGYREKEFRRAWYEVADYYSVGGH